MNRKLRFGAAGAAPMLIAGLLAGCSGSSSSGSSGQGTSPLTVGELFPFSGNIGSVIKGIVTGADVAIKVINANGGVLGHPLVVAPGDTGGDIAEAVTAWRALELHKPVFELGPTSGDAPAVLKFYDPAHLPDLTVAGGAGYDTMPYKYVFRGTPGDDIQGTAMALYAAHIGAKRAAFLISNDVSGQSLIPALTKTFEAHGGTIVSKSTLAPALSSYKSDLQQAFAQHPDVVFWHTDEATAGTLFHNMQSLGLLNVPIIGDDSGTDTVDAKAMGLTTASRYLFGTSAASAQGQATQTYAKLYQQYNGTAPKPSSNIFYDAVNMFALAMVQAKSTDSKVWINSVTKVTNPPGTACYDYVACVALLKSGKDIDYQGASDNYDYNQYHNIYGSWSISGWGSDGTTKEVFQLSAADVAKG
jgi:ABC-type branched-subunit amino acid transport system substrate-binding protein